MKAIMREDEHHQEKHSYFLNLPNKESYKVILFGDSLTRRWEDYPQQWKAYMEPLKALNMGVGADCLENMQWRLENGELEGLNPEVFVLLMGTNNLDKDDDDTILKRIKLNVDLIHQKFPRARILLQGLYPRDRDEKGTDYNLRINKINSDLMKMYSSGVVEFLNPGPQLLSPEGAINRDIMPDGLHLNDAGYEVLGPLLVEAIKG